MTEARTLLHYLHNSRRRDLASSSSLPLPPPYRDMPFDPCLDGYTTQYLNRADVVAAIHADADLGYAWSECSRLVNYNQSDMNVGMESYWEWLLAHPVNSSSQSTPLHLTVFSGDDDSVCATRGTQEWMWGLSLELVSDWKPWYTSDKQVGGYVVKWSPNLTLVTVHAAGHMVSFYKPMRGFEVFLRYLTGEF